MKLEDIQIVLDKANHAYYTLGTEIMTDAKYDVLKDELKKMNPSDPRLTTVGSSIRDTILQKKKHAIPMGSQNKASNEIEWNNWLIRNNFSNTSFLASHKMDGGSLSLEYNNGALVSAITRGDGFEGEDVLANALKLKNTPPTAILPNGQMFTGFIRGEVVLCVDEWKEIDPELESNPRNLATGILRRKDGTQSEYLSFYAFRIYDGDGELFGDTEQELFDRMVKMGFNVAPYIVGQPSEIWNWFVRLHKERPQLSYWIDGIVCSINDLDKQLSLGESSNCPKGAIAIKFPSEGAVTILKNVVWSVGHTGAISPVGEVESVRVCGVNISNVTLCNMEYIDALDLHIGDKIDLIRANDVIPRVMSVNEPSKHRIKINAPTICPCCGGAVGHKNNVGGDDSTAIYCLNETCFAVVCGRIEKYTKSLDIQGVGSNVIESMVKDLQVNSPADLYTLFRRRDVIANLTLSGGGRFGESRTDKILEEIDKKREMTLSDFIGSLGLFGLGKRRVILIQNAVPGLMDNLDDWLGDKLVKYAVQIGIPNIAFRIHDEIIRRKDVIEEFIANGIVIKATAKKKEIKPGDKVICITGTLHKKKSFYYELIEKKGNIATDTWSNDVTHLVAADKNSGSSKIKKATKRGIPIMDEDELMKMLQS